MSEKTNRENQNEKTKKNKNKNNLSALLHKWVNNRDMSDVKFIVGKEKVAMYGHQLILSMNSPVWRGLFYTQEWKETNNRLLCEVVVDDVDPRFFELFLQFLYSRKAQLDEETFYGVYGVADKFCVFELQEYCSRYFTGMLTLTNCIQHYERACGEGVKRWQRDSLQFLESNSRLLFKDTHCFVGLKEETVHQMLRMDSISTPEIQLFRALIEWARSHLRELGSDSKVTVKDLVKRHLHLIRLELMSFEDLDEVSKTGYFEVQELVKHSFNLAKRFQVKIRILSRGGAKLRDLNILVLAWARRGELRVEHFVDTLKYGGIQYVTTKDPRNVTPTIEEMMEYDAVVLRSANVDTLGSSEILGNNLAEFVESGRGLVIVAINTLIDSDDKQIKGRIYTDNFVPLVYGTRIQKNERELGEKHLPEHPILRGVETFKTKDYAHIIDTNNINGGTLIASWNNGLPLVTEKIKEPGYGPVVVINTHPTSTRTTNDCGKAWLDDTNGNELFSNAIGYAGMKRHLK
ncbi:lute [Anaeramoeba flamelloides]|uniref:Lute n=1 Tax=Anaeramoeba flamelloides TaxID=1746091 RepID=A0ABQ8YLX3_9EUKA|nr:lute [Anaeramoeba flamelloides]